MVGACQQNSGIFLVRGGGAEQEICGVRRRARCRWRPGLGPGRDSDDQITGAGSGKITGAGSGLGARCRRGPRLGPDEIPTTKSPGQAAEGWAETGARFRRSNHRGRQRDVTAANRCWVEADAGGAEAGTGRDADDQITGAGSGKITGAGPGRDAG